MAFNARLYNNADDPKTLNKDLTGYYEVNNIRPTKNCDILNPTFILNYDANYTECNYIVVEAPFSRSYFITDMQIDIGKKIVISCAVDVLQTYKDSIKNCMACVTRNEGIGAPTYVPDNKLPIDPNQRELKTVLFEGGDIGVKPINYTTGKHLIVTMV